MSEQMNGTTVSNGTSLLQLHEYWDQSHTFRWLEIIVPKDLTESSVHDVQQELQQLLAQHGVTLKQTEVHELIRDDGRAEMHHSTVSSLSFALHVLKPIDNSETPISHYRHEIEFFLSKDAMVVIHTDQVNKLFTRPLGEWRTLDCPISDGPLAFLLLRLLRTVVENYHAVLDRVNTRLFTLGQLICTENDQQVQNKLQQDLLIFGRKLFEIRKYFGPLRRVLEHLVELAQGESQQHVPISLKYSWIELNDLRAQVEHLIELVDTYQDMVTNLFGAHQSSVSNQLADISNRMNEHMERLTVIATILTTASVITGFYGMNLHGLGIGSSSSSGAPILLIILAVISFLEYGLFKAYKEQQHITKKSRGTRNNQNNQ